MKKNMLDILYCPKCHGQFNLEKIVLKNEEIYSGVLICNHCKKSFDICNYIPRLIDDYNYSDSWGELWKETGNILRDSFTGLPWHHDVIHGKYTNDGKGLPGTSPFGFGWPKNLNGQRILEIGPGTGNCTEHLVNTGAELMCVDMSDAIDTFPEELLIRPNINVVQGNINENIIPHDYFDRIWLFQVLQHTPSPVETLKNVRMFLKMNGELSVTSYPGGYNPWYYEMTKLLGSKSGWRTLSFLVPPLVRVKFWGQRFFDVIGLPILGKIVKKIMEPIDPRNVYYNTKVGRAKEYIYGIMWERTGDIDLLMRYVLINTFDTITPQYTNCCKDNKTMETWLHDSGYSSCNVWGDMGVRAKAIR